MGRICIYSRVSTVDRQDYSRQISDCLEAIGDRYHSDDIDVYKEKISGYKAHGERPELTRMLHTIEQDNKYYDRIYVTEISRLGRDPSAVRNLVDYLSDLKIPIYFTSINQCTLDDNGDRSSTMNIIIQILIEFANNESITTKKRSKSGLLQSAKNQNVGGGKFIAYGYKKGDDKKMIVDDEEAEVIRRIFKWYSEGNGFNKIAGFLNNEKVPTRVNKFGTQLMKFQTEKTADKVIWSSKTVNDIVANPLYKGQRRYKGEKLTSEEEKNYDGIITKRGQEKFKTLLLDAPAIINAELFDRCNELIKTKTHRNSINQYSYLLKDLLTCGICGRNVFARYKPTPRGDKVYICSSRLTSAGNCGNKGVNITYLESVVYDILIGTKALHNHIDQSDKLIPTVKTDIETLKRQLSVAESALEKQTKKKYKLELLFTSTDMTIERYKMISAEYSKELTITKSKIDLLSKHLSEQTEILKKITNKSKDVQFLARLSSERPEVIAIFKQFIKKIYITKMTRNNNVLVDIHLNIGKQKPGMSLKLMLDLNVTRFKEKTQYTYKLRGHHLLTTYDDRGTLITTEDEIDKSFGDYSIGKYIVPDENIMKL
ncbi:recombinase family protein [Flavobacterium sp. S87F.05.LMB.W.Kidney.N]|uniref:recombinase family protein n=1 Tax=Flavobacterium sp. S87F.05.LMB.W.Kidney.N TaxID=1278758 RepID=UPI0010663101|nr:recombinase family protein [Flavobacterium sp. S87F.05.LMB.W.Kidney.N]TDX11300.1 DNA invertase Pin-like site-specific DNA recombinase [Flavobacterium sp. S87F.05.LMB.W.Kidney.N]